jgi:hypothetical protein
MVPPTATIGIAKKQTEQTKAAAPGRSSERLRSKGTLDGDDQEANSKSAEAHMKQTPPPPPAKVVEEGTFAPISDSFEDILEEDGGGWKWTYVLYPSSQANLRHQIIDQIGQIIEVDPVLSGDLCLVEFDVPAPNNPDLHRVYAAFFTEEQLLAFQSKKTVELIVNGVKNIFQVLTGARAQQTALSECCLRSFLRAWDPQAS